MVKSCFPLTWTGPLLQVTESCLAWGCPPHGSANGLGTYGWLDGPKCGQVQFRWQLRMQKAKRERHSHFTRKSQTINKITTFLIPIRELWSQGNWIPRNEKPLQGERRHRHCFTVCRAREEESTMEAHKRNQLRDFPGGPAVKTPCSQCRGPRFDPWLGD